MKRLNIFLAVYKLAVMTVCSRCSTYGCKKAQLACFSQALYGPGRIMIPTRVAL